MDTPQINETTIPQVNGMTLRDWFAGQALANKYTHVHHPDLIARYAYYIADVMIEARKVDRYYVRPDKV
jgi:hypothetical protein